MFTRKICFLQSDKRSVISIQSAQLVITRWLEKVVLLNKSSLEYCGIEGYSLFLREIKCKDYEYFSFHRRISEES
jgi:L-rhamnose mutarotase